jgi:hypothetical protein
MTRRIQLLAVAVGVLLAGCATMQRDARIRERTSNFAYPKPIEEVWPMVQKLLADKGYHSIEDPASYVLRTDWKEDISHARIANTWTRVVVQGAELPGSRCAVRILRQSKSTAERLSNNPDQTPEGSSRVGAFGDPAEGTTASGNKVDSNHGPGSSANDLAWRSQHNTGDLKHATDDGVGAAMSRDFRLEWELISLVSPESAREIEAEAGAK